MEDLSGLATNNALDPTALRQTLEERGLNNAYDLQLHSVALERAAAEALS
jgi:hypothetical protein